MASAALAAPERGPSLRWWLPGGLLAAEYLVASLFLEHPRGRDGFVVSGVRLAIPVFLAALAGAWLVARRSSPAPPHAPVSPWRPWPALVLQLGAFAATFALGLRTLRPGAPTPAVAELGLLLAGGMVSAGLAVRTAAPLGWLAREAAHRWRLGLVAFAIGLGAWASAVAVEHVWGGLSAFNLRAAAALLGSVVPGVRLLPDEAVIGLGDFEIEIAAVCSGVDGIGLVAVFQSAWIALGRDRLRAGRALLLLPLGIAASIAGNVFRIAVLVFVGGSGWPDLAAGGFHSKLGWILFIGIAFGTMALAERVRWFRVDGGGAAAEAEEPAGPGHRAARAYVAPLLAALAVALVAGMASAGALDRAYGLRILAAVAALLAFRRVLPTASLSPALLPVAAGLLVCAFWIPLGGRALSSLPTELAALAPLERAAWLAVRAAGSVIVVPLVEELAFRGFLLRWLASPDFEAAGPRAWPARAFVISSLAFGLVHGQWLLGTLAGFVFAGVYRWRGRLSDAVLAHAVANAGVAAAVLLGGRWDLWS